MRVFSVLFSFCLIFVANMIFFINAALAQADPPKPNVIFILADDLGYGDLSCYGQEKFTTPNIDRLALEGMKFTQHYSGSTVCAPSRCSLMTGYHTGHCYIRGNKADPKLGGDSTIPAGTLTIAKKFKEAGYASGAFGKWGLGMPTSTGEPMKQGFDEFFGYYGQAQAHNYYPPFLYHNEKKIDLDGKAYSHDLIEAEATRFIRENKDKPFFCYMPVTIPHAAMQVPEKYVAPWREKFPEFEETTAKYSSADVVKNPVAAFPGMMNRLDETVKKVLDLLDELGLAENTIVIFSSDNGPHKEGGHRSDLFKSSGPLRGYKRDLSEGGIRVPFLVRWPSKVKPGTISEHPSAFWDFFPSACEWVGVETPAGIDGISYNATLFGNPVGQKKHEYLYWEFYEQNGKIAARKDDWKGIRVDMKNNPTGPIQLYNLADDIHENRDLAKEQPEIVAEFERIFNDAHIDSELFKW